MIWSYIKAESFFPKYCPAIKSYTHKIRGFNGRGNPVVFTNEEKKAIRAAIKQMAKDEQI